MSGHNSIEDAKACLDLVKLKMEKGNWTEIVILKMDVSIICRCEAFPPIFMYFFALSRPFLLSRFFLILYSALCDATKGMNFGVPEPADEISLFEALDDLKRSCCMVGTTKSLLLEVVPPHQFLSSTVYLSICRLPHAANCPRY